MRPHKVLEIILSGSRNVAFTDFVGLVRAYGFRQARVRGNHHIFVHDKVRELINLQEVNGKAKPSQVRQFLALVEKYDLKIHEGK